MDLYGAKELESGIREALAADSTHASAVKQAPERRRTARGASPPVRLQFEGNPRANDMTVSPRSLARYDNLLKSKEEEQ